MDKPEYIQVTMKAQTFRVFLHLFGRSSPNSRLRMGIPKELNADASDFYSKSGRWMGALGFQAVHKEWKDHEET